MRGQKLLVYHPGALGDVITSFPLLSLLKERFDTIDLICQNSIGKLALELEIINRFFPMEAGTFSSFFVPEGESAETRLRTALNGYDRILLICLSKGIAQRIGQIISNKKVFRITPRPSPEIRTHVSTHLVESSIRVGLLSGREKLVPDILFRDRRSPGFNPKKLLIHPGSGSRMKNWPLSHFLELEKMLRADGWVPRILLGPAEDYLLEKLPRAADCSNLSADISCNSDRLFPPPPIRPENLSSLLETLKSAAAFIGNDSGVTHLAAFLGLDTLAVFGPSDPARWHPMGRSSQAITGNLGCKPCLESENRKCDPKDCLEKLDPRKVREAFRNLKNAGNSLCYL